MGGAASSPFVATKPFYKRKEHASDIVEVVDICLACEKDSYPSETRNVSEMKEGFREFMREALPTDKYTVFRWSTWDEEKADIVIPTEESSPEYDMPSRGVFDAIFTVHCPFYFLEDRSFRTACALLKPLGFLVVVCANAKHIHQAFALRPTPFGDCSEDSSYRLHQVHQSAQGRFQMVVWQKWAI